MMRALDATLGGAVLESPWAPEVGTEQTYFLLADETRYLVRGKVVAVGPRGYRLAFVEPSTEFLEAWGRAILREAKRMNTRGTRPWNASY